MNLKRFKGQIHANFFLLNEQQTNTMFKIAKITINQIKQ